MTDRLVERALVRFVADCSDEEQQLPALQFICNRSPFIAEAITKALASSSVPDRRWQLEEALLEIVSETKYVEHYAARAAHRIASSALAEAPQDRGASQEDGRA